MLTEPEAERRTVNSDGNDRVWMSTMPPEKSPGWSGVNVLIVVMLSRKSLGNRSNWTLRRSGSAVGRAAPLSWVFA